MAGGDPLMRGVEARLYQASLDRLESIDRRLALAAYVVQTLHPDAAAIAEPLLQYAMEKFPGVDVLEAYARRAQALAEMQSRFDADPRPQTLGGGDVPVDRRQYDLSLLLSIALTNHRFEIMQQLDRFLEACAGTNGRIASIGTGTGYELRQMAALLPGDWVLESYDIEPTVQYEARMFLEYFGVHRPVQWEREFPLASPLPEFRGRYDAIVMCELLEHLSDPQTALATARECLKPDGRLFATMAINIAQEDHVFLYPDLAACRTQVHAAGFDIAWEWITPQTILPPPDDREAAFKKGNYVADLRRARALAQRGGQ